MVPHFIYAGESDLSNAGQLILKKMKKYNIKKVMVTSIYMQRHKLVTKETMENHSEGKTRNKQSINDNLESFFVDCRLGKEPDNDDVDTYFLPKASEEELKLIAREDSKFMLSFSMCGDPDVSEAEMEASESDSKYVFIKCSRRTFTIENSFKRKTSSSFSYPTLKTRHECEHNLSIGDFFTTGTADVVKLIPMPSNPNSHI